MITIKEIAVSLHMSTTTVSNVIHGKTGEVSEETIRVLLMDKLSDRGIRVPDDISVIGFDDNYYGRLHRPALTAMHLFSKKGLVKFPKDVNILIATYAHKLCGRCSACFSHRVSFFVSLCSARTVK